ncbi:hypothetical protein BJV74DRAFT_837497 [Russula compacta]|nr:hypothetical protein BJV74DRAFT_837497 [Russula compacta]
MNPPNPLYDFLAPPSPPSPIIRHSRRRSSAISTWVVGVQPGSPPPPSPPALSTLSPRAPLFGRPRSTRHHSRSFISFADTPTIHTIYAPTYNRTTVPLPIPPYTSATSSPSPFLAEGENDSGADEKKMKLPLLTLMRQRKASTSVTGPRSPSLPKKRGLMRFLRPQLPFRSMHTHTQHPPQSPPSTHARKASPLPPSSSPTTVAFRMAHQKRALYAKCGALPLPLDTEVALMQYMDGGKRADAMVRLGATYQDTAGVVYADEMEAWECLPLLHAPEDDADPPSGLPSTPSGASERLGFTSAPPSPLSPMTSALPASAPTPHFPAQRPTVSSARALFSIPARGGGTTTTAPGYLHTAPPSLPPPPFGGGIVSKPQFAPLPVVEATMASRRKQQRRRPAPLVLHLPAARVVGFEDSFAPTVAIDTPSLAARESGVESRW